MEPAINLKVIKQYKWYILGGAFLLSVLVTGILALTGTLDCERTSIRGGVYQTCDCVGFEVEVKNTTSSGERKTICLGKINNKQSYQQ